MVEYGSTSESEKPVQVELNCAAEFFSPDVIPFLFQYFFPHDPTNFVIVPQLLLGEIFT